MISKSASSRSLFNDSASRTGSLDFSFGSEETIDEDDDEDEDEETKSFKEKFVNLVMDYGPPYSEDPGGDLFMEVAGPLPSLSKIHSLLLNGANPNKRDPTDVGLTPMHYAARFGLFHVVKLFDKAAGNPNITNELGQTPLGLSVLFVAVPDRRKKQLQTVRLLCLLGGDPNALDRGGFTPLSYAARNNDAASIRILLHHGAKIYRRRERLNLPFQSALELTTDHHCRLLLQRQATVEEQAEHARKEAIHKRQQELDRIMKAKELEDEKAARRRKERLAKASKQEEKHNQWKETIRREQFEKEKQAQMAVVSIPKVKRGAWARTGNGQWELQYTPMAGASATTLSVMDQSQKLMQELQGRYRYDVLNTRWNQLTGHNLERPLARASMFQDLNETARTDKDVLEDIEVIQNLAITSPSR